MEDPFEESKELYEYQKNFSGKGTMLQSHPSPQDFDKVDSGKTIEFKKKRIQFADIKIPERDIQVEAPTSERNIAGSPQARLTNSSSIQDMQTFNQQRFRHQSSTSKYESNRINIKAIGSIRTLTDPDEGKEFGYLKQGKGAERLKNLMASGMRRSNNTFGKLGTPRQSQIRDAATLQGLEQAHMQQSFHSNRFSIVSENLNNLIEPPDPTHPHENALPAQDWVNTEDFQSLNMKFQDKYSMNSILKDNYSSKIWSVKTKNDFWNGMETESQFQITCEEKRNEDVQKIVAGTKGSSNSEKKPRFSFRNSLASLMGCVRKKKLSHCIAIALMSPCGNFLATVSNDNDVLVFYLDVESPEGVISKHKAICLEKREASKFVLQISWSSDSGFLAAVFVESRWLQVWELRNPTRRIEFEHEQFLSAIQFHNKSPDFLLTGSLDKIIRMWSLRGSEMVRWNQTGDLITCIEHSPSGDFFLVGTAEGKVALYKNIDQIRLSCEASLKDLPYRIKKTHIEDDPDDPNKHKEVYRLQARRCESKKKSGLFSILFKKRSFHHKIIQIQFVSAEKNDQVLVLTYSGRLKLLSLEPEWAVLESFKVSQNTIPIAMDCFNNHVLMNSEFGPASLWQTGNKYFPVFNPVLFHINRNTNQSVENYQPLNTKIGKNFFVSRFLGPVFLERYNQAHPSKPVHFMVVMVSCSGDLKVDKKLEDA
jgi:hypothetical protein